MYIYTHVCTHAYIGYIYTCINWFFFLLYIGVVQGQFAKDVSVGAEKARFATQAPRQAQRQGG